MKRKVQIKDILKRQSEECIKHQKYVEVDLEVDMEKYKEEYDLNGYLFCHDCDEEVEIYMEDDVIEFIIKDCIYYVCFDSLDELAEDFDKSETIDIVSEFRDTEYFKVISCKMKNRIMHLKVKKI
ncbi:hypothetical protein P0Y35_11710 [Kiritimatiellaeota bacterium B1221]|nr:hypothetical protein [Kiritimatiellaeota bacterium B1221]